MKIVWAGLVFAVFCERGGWGAGGGPGWPACVGVGIDGSGRH
jgi:hypothetical protein